MYQRCDFASSGSGEIAASDEEAVDVSALAGETKPTGRDKRHFATA
jgi:hypothetical protein